MDTPPQQENIAGSPPTQGKFTSRRRAIISWITGLIVGLLVLASLVARYRQPLPTVVARQYLSEQGAFGDNFELVGYKSSSFPPGVLDRATVEFRVTKADPPKKVEVELFRPVYFVPWHGTAFREKVEKE